MFRLKSSKFFSTSAKKIVETDVLIVGGGVPGLSLASALVKDTSYNVTLMDKKINIDHSLFEYTAGRLPDPRIISLNESSHRYMRYLGAELNYKLMNKIDRIKIYESVGSSRLVFDSQKSVSLPFLPSNDKEYLFYTVEIPHLQSALLKTVENSRLNLLEGISLSEDNTELVNTSEYAELTVDDTTYRAKLLVASDGANSLLRSKANMGVYGLNYNETGIVATFEANQASSVAFQRFLQSGILALLPLYENKYSIVLSLSKGLNAKLLKTDDEQFLNTVNDFLHSPPLNDTSALDRLFSGNDEKVPVLTKLVSKKYSFPLKLQWSDRFAGGSMVLLGDSAHSIHPMAGQGLNLGITESAVLADTITKGYSIGRRLNELRSLEEYEKRAKSNFFSQAAGQETIKTLFSSRNYALSLGRNLGMSLANSTSVFPSLFMSASTKKSFLPERYI